jgi:hypothetical protein
VKRAGYELWDLDTGNAVGEYDHIGEATAALRKSIRKHGPSIVQGIALIQFDDRGRDRIYAQGEELLRLVQPRSFVKG